MLLIWRDVDSPDVQLCGQSSCLLVEEEGALSVDEEVVVDGSEAGAQLQLGLLVAQV